MPNCRKKEAMFRTMACHRSMLKIQVTDVRKPLVCGCRIFDAGHKVVVTRAAGYAQHETTGQTTFFHRVQDEVEAFPPRTAGFPRPGK